MRIIFFGLLVVSPMAFANPSELECDVVSERRQISLTPIEFRNIVDCGFLRAGLVCDYYEGHDRFSAPAFEPGVIASARVGDRIQGVYLNGYVYKTWVVDSEESMTCLVR